MRNTLYRRLSLCAALCAAQVLLSACGFELDTDALARMSFSQRKVEQQEPYVLAPASRAWVDTPSTGLVLMRGLQGGVEQKVALQNTTSAMGDNELVLRTRSGAFAGGRLRYEEFVQRVGGLPQPFQELKAGELMTDEDEMGPYFWAQKLYGTQTVCVIAFRRVTAAMRILPNDADVMDVMLRNCIAGTTEQALLPIMAESLATGPVRGVAPSQQIKLLSPLAGPEV